MGDRLGAWPLRQWVRVALVIAAVAVILYLAVAAWPVLVPFLVGLIVAWIVLPAVNWLERQMPRRLQRGGIARVLAIVIVYAGVLLLVAAFLGLLVPIVLREAEELYRRRLEIYAALRARLVGLSQWYEAAVPASVRAYIQQQFPSTPEGWLSQFERGFLARAVATLRSSWAVVGGYLIVPFWLIYVIYDAGRLRRAILGAVPENALPDVVNLGHIANRVAGAYLRGQLLVAASIGFLTGLALYLLGVPFPIVLGALTGLFDLVPTFGPIIAGIPTLIIAGLKDPLLALWAFLAIVAIREFEDLFIGPHVVGASVRFRPELIIVVLLAAGYLWGLLGLLLAVPVAAVLRDLFRYLYLRTLPRGVSPDEALRQVSRPP